MSDIQEEIKIAHKKALEQDFNEILKELKQEEHKNLELSMRINKAIEYINKYCEDYVVEDSPDPMCLFYGDDGTYKPEAKQELLEILQGKE